MKKRVLTLSSVSALALLLVHVAAAPAGAQLANIKNTGEALLFYATQEAEAFALTVTGPCNYEYRKRTEKGEIVFKLPKDAMDGTYSFSLDATPRIDPEVMEILHKARATGDNRVVRELCRDGRLPTGATNQSGGFAVVERRIILDTTPEVRRNRRDEGKRAAGLTPKPQSATGADLADDFLAASPVTRLAHTDTSASTSRPGECVWARMQPGAGVAER